MSVYIGYDLGDGDTFISTLSMDRNGKKQLEPVKLTPGHVGPIPSIYGKTEIGQVLLGTDCLQNTQVVMQECDANFKKKPGTQSEIEFCRYEQNVVTFTDELFRQVARLNPGYFKNMGNEFVLSVGHPTTWSSEDIKKYRKIFERTRLFRIPEQILGRDGVTVKFVLSSESDAALINLMTGGYRTSDDHVISIDDIPDNECVVVFDFGSSTTDVSVFQKKNGLLVSIGSELEDPNLGACFIGQSIHGDPMLGARLIDKSIYEEVVKEMEQRADAGEEMSCVFKKKFDATILANPPARERCRVWCRLAKEQMFDAKRCKAPVVNSYGGPLNLSVYLTEEVLNRALDHRIPKLKNLTFEESCKNLMSLIKNRLDAKNRKLSTVFLTGGASKMDFIENIAKDIFPESVFIASDPNPSCCVSYGLAYLPYRLEQQGGFLNAVEKLNESIPGMVSQHISSLASELSLDLTNLVLSVVRENVLKWRRGGYTTLNGMEFNLNSCVESELRSKQTEKMISKATMEFIKDSVVPEIHSKFNRICREYNVSGGNLSDVRSGDGGREISVEIDIADQISASISDEAVSFFIGAIFVAVLVPIIATLAALIAELSIPIISAIATAIAGILGMALGPGTILLIAIAGVSATYVATHGIDSVKKHAIDKMKGYDLPQWVREKVSISKIDKIINQQKDKVRNEIRRQLENNAEFKKSVSQNIGPALQKVIDKVSRDLVFRIRD